jgi:hypothetical protein
VEVYLKSNYKIDNPAYKGNDYNDYIQSKNDEVVDEPLLQSPL